MNVKSTLSAVAIAGMLVVSADYATQAATGGSFILGRSNGANQTTALTNVGPGPVLRLWTTHPGTNPPLNVNSKVRVARLNADLVDGRSAGQLGVKTRVYRAAVNVTGVLEFDVVVPSVNPGRYLVTYGAWLFMTPTTTSGWCWADRGAGNFITASAEAASNSRGYALPNGSGILRRATKGNVRVHCEYTDPVTAHSYLGAPMEIVLTRITTQTGSRLPRTAPRLAPRTPSS